MHTAQPLEATGVTRAAKAQRGCLKKMSLLIQGKGGLQGRYEKYAQRDGGRNARDVIKSKEQKKGEIHAYWIHHRRRKDGASSKTRVGLSGRKTLNPPGWLIDMDPASLSVRLHKQVGQVDAQLGTKNWCAEQSLGRRWDAACQQHMGGRYGCESG